MNQELSADIDTPAQNPLGLLLDFAGPPQEFWPRFLETIGTLADGRIAWLALAREDDVGNSVWRPITAWFAARRDHGGETAKALLALVPELAEAAWADGSATRELPRGGAAVGVRLAIGGGTEPAVAVLLLSAGNAATAVAPILELAAAVPQAYQGRRLTQQAQRDVGQFAAALDLMVLLNAETRFLASAMTLCNEIASRYQCSRTSLGWEKAEYVRLVAISHTEKFERKMDAVRRLEVLMEEALDQDEEILVPAPAESTAVCRDHQAFAREEGGPYVCSLPLRADGRPVAVITCERTDRLFDSNDVAQLRLCCDQAVRRLADLKHRDRWFGARWLAALRRFWAMLLGVEHTWAKVAALAGIAAVVALTVCRAPYRVEAPFLIRTDDAVHLPAPFDGYLAEAKVEVGDTVREGQILLSLDKRDLLLEEAAAGAELTRARREAEKARADDALADMQIAEATAEQARVRLKQVRHRLEQSDVVAPFGGIVVEGDLRERIGAPLPKGETLYRLARLDQLYVELEVDEADVDEVRPNADGKIAFASRPQQSYPIEVTRIEPIAQPKAGKNIILVRAAFSEGMQSWCRPGMSGIAKVNAGQRRLIWIFTHRTVDFVRLRLWW